MYNERLAAMILEMLDREYPSTTTVARLMETLPEFSSQTRDDWFAAVDALQKAGLVGCKMLRSGIGQIDDIGPILITERGRREQHSIAAGSKSGLFISHVAEEKDAAMLLKDFLRDAFGADLKVFVSSDYESIQSGKDWFNSIVDALRSAQMVLVLLSEAALERRWINFEAGVGIGARATVVPLVFRGLAKGKIGPPLSALQARSLNDADDVRAMVNDIRLTCGLTLRNLDAHRLVSELGGIERKLPSKRAILTPYVISQPYGLRFRIENDGNQDIELLMVECAAPKRYLDPNWKPECDPNVLEVINELIETEPYLRLRFRAFEGPTSPNFGTIERLPRILAVGMPAYELKPPFAFALRPGLKEADGVDVPIFYAAYAKGMQPDRHQTSYRQLVMRSYMK